MLRRNRMIPAGGKAQNRAFSSADKVGPAIPTIAAFTCGRTRSEIRHGASAAFCADFYAGGLGLLDVAKSGRT